jgi:hypothetical protein
MFWASFHVTKRRFYPKEITIMEFNVFCWAFVEKPFV